MGKNDGGGVNSTSETIVPEHEESLPAHFMSRDISLALIDADPNQPRRHFAEESLRELAESIGASGLAVPICVRPMGDRFRSCPREGATTRRKPRPAMTTSRAGCPLARWGGRPSDASYSTRRSSITTRFPLSTLAWGDGHVA